MLRGEITYYVQFHYYLYHCLIVIYKSNNAYSILITFIVYLTLSNPILLDHGKHITMPMWMLACIELAVNRLQFVCMQQLCTFNTSNLKLLHHRDDQWCWIQRVHHAAHVTAHAHGRPCCFGARRMASGTSDAVDLSTSKGIGLMFETSPWREQMQSRVKPPVPRSWVKSLSARGAPYRRSPRVRRPDAIIRKLNQIHSVQQPKTLRRCARPICVLRSPHVQEACDKQIWDLPVSRETPPHKCDRNQNTEPGPIRVDRTETCPVQLSTLPQAA